MADNLKNEYFQILTKNGLDVDDAVEEYYSERVRDTFPEKKLITEQMLSRKKGKQKLRATATYLAACAFAGEEVTDYGLKNLIAAVELINWSSYCLNWIMDDKATDDNINHKKRQLLAIQGFFNDAVQIVRNDTHSYIRRLMNPHSHLYLDTFIEINDRILRGYQAEESLHISNSAILEDFDKFWQVYRTRNIEAVGQFFGNCVKVAAIYVSADESLENRLMQSFTLFGEGIEILNDLSDFIIPREKAVSSEKNASDQFSDLRTGTVTWPVWLIYDNASSNDKDFLKGMFGRRPSQDDSKKIFKLFSDSGAYETIKTHLFGIRKEIHSQLHETDIKPKYRGLLECMTSILTCNKYFFALKGDATCLN